MQKLFVRALVQPAAPRAPLMPGHELRRLHRRFGPFAAVIRFYHPSLGELEVANLSFAGILLSVPLSALARHLTSTGTLLGELCGPSGTVACELLPLSDFGRGVGCRIIHSDQSVILFLRRYLTPYHLGTNLVAVAGKSGCYSLQRTTLNLRVAEASLFVATAEQNFSLSLRGGAQLEMEVVGSNDSQAVLAYTLMLLLGFASVDPAAAAAANLPNLTQLLLAELNAAGAPAVAQLKGVS